MDGDLFCVQPGLITALVFSRLAPFAQMQRWTTRMVVGCGYVAMYNTHRYRTLVFYLSAVNYIHYCTNLSPTVRRAGILFILAVLKVQLYTHLLS